MFQAEGKGREGKYMQSSETCKQDDVVCGQEARGMEVDGAPAGGRASLFNC